MDFWTLFWTCLLVVAVVVFAGLAVVVTIGGFSDVWALFRSIDAKHADADKDNDAQPEQ